MLLRQHFLDGLSGGELAAMYKVHRVTVVRRIGAIKRRLVEELRLELGSRLSLPNADIDSVIRILRAEFSVSIERLLAPDERPD